MHGLLAAVNAGSETGTPLLLLNLSTMVSLATLTTAVHADLPDRANVSASASAAACADAGADALTNMAATAQRDQDNETGTSLALIACQGKPNSAASLT